MARPLRRTGCQELDWTGAGGFWVCCEQSQANISPGWIGPVRHYERNDQAR
jgi:hypothetical protein